MLHMQGDKLEHVGILHHNPQGQVAFFHRTSGGKVNSLAAPGDMFNTNYTTVPLTAKAAWDMFEGASESGNYRYPKQRHPHWDVVKLYIDRRQSIAVPTYLHDGATTRG